jgi:hypothetical protein
MDPRKTGLAPSFLSTRFAFSRWQSCHLGITFGVGVTFGLEICHFRPVSTPAAAPHRQNSAVIALPITFAGQLDMREKVLRVETMHGHGFLPFPCRSSSTNCSTNPCRTINSLDSCYVICSATATLATRGNATALRKFNLVTAFFFTAMCIRVATPEQQAVERKWLAGENVALKTEVKELRSQ